MTGYQMLVQKTRSGDSNAGDDAPASWEEAPAPAQVAEKVSAGVFDKELPLREAASIANRMHWSYGTLWGTIYGIAKASFPATSPPTAGALFGASLWSASYAQLVPMGIYKPPWKYPASEVALDISYHLVYGLAAAFAFELID